MQMEGSARHTPTTRDIVKFYVEQLREILISLHLGIHRDANRLGSMAFTSLSVNRTASLSITA